MLQAVEEAALAGEEDLVAVAVAQPTKQDLAIAATGIRLGEAAAQGQNHPGGRAGRRAPKFREHPTGESREHQRASRTPVGAPIAGISAGLGAAALGFAVSGPVLAVIFGLIVGGVVFAAVNAS